MKALCILAPLLLLSASSALGQTVVYDSVTTGAKFYGHGAWGIDNFNNGDPALGTYQGASPAFEFIPAGDDLSGFKVGIGDDLFTGVFNFHVTLFTSGASEQLDPSLWARLGGWGGQTDGQFDSGAGGVPSLISVAAGGVTLVNGQHYYLMATADANQGLNGSGINNLDWGYNTSFTALPVWEPLLPGFQHQPFRNTSVPGAGVFQVLVAPGGPVVPEGSSLALLGSGLLPVAAFAWKKRRSRR